MIVCASPTCSGENREIVYRDEQQTWVHADNGYDGCYTSWRVPAPNTRTHGDRAMPAEERRMMKGNEYNALNLIGTPVTVEHHPDFTAVNAYGHLAAVVVGGTLEERQAVSDAAWLHIATRPSG